MGQKLDHWWETNGPAIQDILRGGFGRGLGMDRSSSQPQPPAPQPTSAFDSAQADNSPWVTQPDQAAFEQADQAAQAAGDHGPAFQDNQQETPGGGYEPGGFDEEASGDQVGAADEAEGPAFTDAQPQAQQQGPPQEGRVSFMDVTQQADPKAKQAAIKNIEDLTGQDINDIYAQSTGNDGGDLTKEQKADLLMEFGLRLMATPSTAGDVQRIGTAGLGTLDTSQKMEEYNRTGQARALDKTLDAEVQLAQIDNYRRDKSRGRADRKQQFASGGKLWVRDESGNAAQPILGPDGTQLAADPKSGANGGRGFEFEAKKVAYEQIHCQGLRGEAARSCSSKALDFAAKGGFDSSQKFDLGAQIRKELYSPDNGNKYPQRQGNKIVKVSWSKLTTGEQDAVLRMTVDRAWSILSGGNDEPTQQDSAPTPGEGSSSGSAFDMPAIDLTQEELDSIPEGKIAVIQNDDGTTMKIRKVNGQPEVVQ